MKTLSVLVLAIVATTAALAADPPARVGRLAHVEGEVLLFTDPEQGWEAAGLNSHVTSENSVWTEPRSRAEVRIGATALRLEEATQLDVARLEDDQLRAHLVRGSLAVRIRYFEKGDLYSVTTPEARFQLRGNGRYRIESDPERAESRLTVFSGHARLEAAGGYVTVDTGRSVRVSAGGRGTYEMEAAYSTALDEWALARDERYAERPASRYVSPRMTGWEDLDEYGEWRNEPEFGSVWYPSHVEADWAPYRNGRWTYVRPWGWSWVDDAPWGYAPFHYGRWVYAGNRWGWYPGRYVARPVWAPALVGWVGRPGWSVSVSAGPASVVGWYPLSPWDRYQPWYSSNVTYVNNINHVVIVNRRPPHHEHWNRDHGATVVTREAFVSHQPVHRNRSNVAREVIAAQPIVAGQSVLPARSEWRAPRSSKPLAVETHRPAVGGESVTGHRPSSRPEPSVGGGFVGRPGTPAAPQVAPSSGGASAGRPPHPGSPQVAPSAGGSVVAKPAMVPESAPSRPGTPAPHARPAYEAPARTAPASSVPAENQRSRRVPAESRENRERRDAPREVRESRPAPAPSQKPVAESRGGESRAARSAEKPAAQPAQRAEQRPAAQPAQRQEHRQEAKPAPAEKPGRAKDGGGG